MPFINLKTIPFSFRNAYFVLALTPENRLVVRDIRGGDLDRGHIFYVEGLGLTENFRVEADESLLTITNTSTNATVLEITFQCPEVLRFKSQQVPIRLSAIQRPYEAWCDLGQNRFEYASYFKEMKYGVSILSGESASILDQTTLEFSGEIALECYKVVPKHLLRSAPEFIKITSDNQRLVNSWTERFTSQGQDPLLRQAAYILWMNFVGEEGHLKYPALYMTKNWMTNIWSWDNCFSAIGLCRVDPRAALEQIWIFESLQDDSGALPDYANDRYISFSCTKPPILGWTFDQMAQRNPEAMADFDVLSRFYKLAKGQIEYWLNHRMSDMGLPYYTHGNDSGWDNGTFYSEGVPLIAPDLVTYAIYQLGFLKRSAVKLGLSNDIIKWESYQEQLLDVMMKSLWQKDRFVAIKSPEMKVIKCGDTLQRLIPLMIADLLPIEVVEEMLKDLSHFTTPFGLATEAPTSDYYAYNGYWRGPVWAPVMLMMVSALKHLKKDALFLPLGKAFEKCVEVGGFAENFDPLTGEGLVDTGFAWTAAVYVTLRQDSENDIMLKLNKETP